MISNETVNSDKLNIFRTKSTKNLDRRVVKSLVRFSKNIDYVRSMVQKIVKIEGRKI